MAATLDAEVGELVERIFALPFDAQLALVRTVAPHVLTFLDADAQQTYLRDLLAELARCARGEAIVEPAPAVPTY